MALALERAAAAAGARRPGGGRGRARRGAWHCVRSRRSGVSVTVACAPVTNSPHLVATEEAEISRWWANEPATANVQMMMQMLPMLLTISLALADQEHPANRC